MHIKARQTINILRFLLKSNPLVGGAEVVDAQVNGQTCLLRYSYKDKR